MSVEECCILFLLSLLPFQIYSVDYISRFSVNISVQGFYSICIHIPLLPPKANTLPPFYSSTYPFTLYISSSSSSSNNIWTVFPSLFWPYFRLSLKLGMTLVQ